MTLLEGHYYAIAMFTQCPKSSGLSLYHILCNTFHSYYLYSRLSPICPSFFKMFPRFSWILCVCISKNLSMYRVIKQQLGNQEGTIECCSNICEIKISCLIWKWRYNTHRDMYKDVYWSIDCDNKICKDSQISVTKGFVW